MAKVNCLSDRAKLILSKVDLARKDAEHFAGPHASAIQELCRAIDLLVLNNEPLWEKRDEGDCEYEEESDCF